MKKLYSNDKTAQIDQLAAAELGIDSYALMQLAGAAVYEHVKLYTHLLVVAGPGNNGGDGYVIAELARKNNQQVKLLAMRPIEHLKGDARKAAEDYQGPLITLAELKAAPNDAFDCVIDALFGTGLNQEVKGDYLSVIEWMNQQDSKTIAVDIPSGLNGSSGQIEGCAVKADMTVSVLARNTGLFTMDGKAQCGDVVFAALGVSQSSYASVQHTAQLLTAERLSAIGAHRTMNSHKGQFGHVLTVGGQAGMLGAVLLAAKAVMKSGAGMSTVITDASHVDFVPLYAPELMTHSYDTANDSHSFSQQYTSHSAEVLLIGMGLGQSQWSKQLLKESIRLNIPLVIDADGLNLLSDMPAVPDHLKVITPHPKEAANLLKISTAAVQQDRWHAVKSLAKKFNCVAVLKGSGTLISEGENIWCCPFGNSNLSTAGAGDVLAGMVAGLLAQGHTAAHAAQYAVTWHALAGEHHVHGFTMTASDLLSTLHTVFNAKF